MIVLPDVFTLTVEVIHLFLLKCLYFHNLNLSRLDDVSHVFPVWTWMPVSGLLMWECHVLFSISRKKSEIVMLSLFWLFVRVQPTTVSYSSTAFGKFFNSNEKLIRRTILILGIESSWHVWQLTTGDLFYAHLQSFLFSLFIMNYVSPFCCQIIFEAVPHGVPRPHWTFLMSQL